LTGEKVAVKILEKDKIKDSSDIERVSREIKILKQVNHPHIIKLFEIIETPKQLYLIMEYASGGELFDYIVARSRLKESQACIFLQQLLAGVEYLQQIKVVHRDLKPENLLLDEHKNIKIVDFGLSNLYKGDETLKTACGSPCYAAPEMIAGKRYHGSCVDVWSCGVILFAMLCGYLPFEDPNTSNLYKKILGGEYKCGNWVSNEAQDILKKILSTNPDNRYTIDMIRSHPWYTKYAIKNFLKEIPDSEPIKIDENIIKQMESLGLSQEITRDSIIKNKHNKFTSTYHLLVKKLRYNEANFSINSKIAMAPLIVPNPRGDSHSINPRVKKIFEIKSIEKSNNRTYKEPEILVKTQKSPGVRDAVYIRPTPHRRIYGNTYRDPRAASTGFQAIRTAGLHVPRDPNHSITVNRNTYRPSNVKTPLNYHQDVNISLTVPMKTQSPRAGTALDISLGKYDPKNHSFR
jgi:serine/threonine protein kinase